MTFDVGNAMISRHVACVISVLLIHAMGCRVADLREETALEDVSTIPASSRERGEALLADMLAAHGGMAAHDAQDTARVVLRDTWPSFLERTFVMPWEESGQRLELWLDLGTEHSRMTLLDGPQKGRTTGIQNWVTYHVNGRGEVVFSKDEETWFWLPTMHYFFEAAFRIGEAQYVGYAGERTYEGRTYQGVFLTWSDVEPNMSVDQYVAWIDPDTSRLAMLEYTVRDFYRFVTGTAVYTDYATIKGIVLPQKITIYSGEVDDGDVLHRLDVEEIELGGIAKDLLIPDPGRAAKKQDRGAQ